jgi:membrane protease YdiL (CAAX protease family)
MAASNGLFALHPILDYIFHVLGGFGPFVSAFLLTYLYEKKQGVLRLWKQFWNVNIGIKWILITFLLFPTIMLSALLIAIIFEQAVPEILYINEPWMYLIIFIRIFFVGGAFNEEFGWRGYTIDRFQVKWNAVISSVILGVIWSVWHIPLFLTVGRIQHGQSFILYIMMVTLLSILFTWIYNNTNKNILATVIFHTVFNFSNILFPIQDTATGLISYGFILLTITLIIIKIYGSEDLKK